MKNQKKFFRSSLWMVLINLWQEKSEKSHLPFPSSWRCARCGRTVAL